MKTADSPGPLPRWRNRARSRVNARLDALVRPTLHIGRIAVPSYGFFVTTGILLAYLLALILSRAAELPLAPVAGVLTAGVATAVAFAFLTKLLVGHEVFTFYHYQIVVVTACSALLAGLGRPVLPFLDVVVLTLGFVQAVGRLGCLSAGCCHGRPHAWGVRYREEHAEQGFPHAFVGVRLFPVQAVESASIFVLVAAGTEIVVSGLPAGTVLAFYVAGYGALRFVLELFRGDAVRPHGLGLSEAQWTSLGCLGAVTAGGWTEALPLRLWPSLFFAATALAALAVATLRRLRPARRLLEAGHVAEIAGILDELARTEPSPAWPALATPQVRVGCTSLGVKLSGSGFRGPGGHYALSSRDGLLAEEAARRLAELIVRLRHPSEPNRFLPGHHGVFHLLVGGMSSLLEERPA